MKFYTNVEQSGNTILVRGYDNGKRFTDKVKFNPTLYLSSSKQEQWKTLEGNNVRPVKQGTIKDARDFIKDHQDIEDFYIYVKQDF